jgi:hypothetical protein
MPKPPSKRKKAASPASTDSTSAANSANEDTALPAAIRYILKAESDDRRGARRKIYRIRAGSAVSPSK